MPTTRSCKAVQDTVQHKMSEAGSTRLRFFCRCESCILHERHLVHPHPWVPCGRHMGPPPTHATPESACGSGRNRECVETCKMRTMYVGGAHATQSVRQSVRVWHWKQKTGGQRGLSQVEQLMVKLRDQVDSGGREGNATAWAQESERVTKTCVFKQPLNQKRYRNCSGP